MSDTPKPIKLIVTLVAAIEYDANPADYGTDDPAAMALIDEDNWRNDPLTLWSTFEDDQFSILVKPAQAKPALPPVPVDEFAPAVVDEEAA